MTALAVSTRAALTTPRSLVAELMARHAGLARYGLALGALGLVAVALQYFDPRTLASGTNVWVKPAKFAFSLGLFALTSAWFMGYVRPERRGSGAMRGTAWALMATATFELAYITFQGARGLESHFNVSSPLPAAMYALMGLAAVGLTATTLPLAWEIARRPVAGLQPSFVAAVVMGLVLTFVLGAGFGGYMSSQTGHAVGPVGGKVPLVGWNRLGGDLRVAHFFGIHAEQAIPFLAALTAGAGARLRWLAVAVGVALYIGLTVAVFAQAVMGEPILPA